MPSSRRTLLTGGAALFGLAGCLDASPGEATTNEVSVGYYRGSDSPPARVQFGVVGPGLSDSFSVRIEGDGTATST